MLKKKPFDIAHADARPRIQIRPSGGRWEWKRGVGPWGTSPNVAETPQQAFAEALDAIGHVPCVVIYGRVPLAPDFER